jgi:hypothetical protein
MSPGSKIMVVGLVCYFMGAYIASPYNHNVYGTNL